MNDINIHYDRESIIREQRAEETFEMVADNVEALGGNFEQNSKTRAGKEYRGHSKLEREIIEDVTTEDLVVDKKGRVQKVIHADFSQQKDMEKVQNEVLSPRKRDVERGVVNVDLRDKKNSGQTLKIEQARNRLADRKGKLIDLKTQNTLAKLQSKGIRFSKEQRTAIEEAIREQAEEELKEQIDSHKIYKNAA